MAVAHHSVIQFKYRSEGNKIDFSVLLADTIGYWCAV